VLISESERDLALRKAAFKADTDRAQADADAAGVLAKAGRDQEVLTVQEKVAERQAALTERKLDTEVRKPADAARYKREQEAQANRNAVQFEAEGRSRASIADAEAAAERTRLSSTAEAQRVKISAEAEAERVRISSEADASSVRVAAEAELARRTAAASAARLEGEAEAASIEARGRAEGVARQLAAEAFEQYGDAARLQMVVEVLPQLAAALAEPLKGIDGLTVISNDGAGHLSKSVANNLAETLETVRRTTGVDLVGLLGSRNGTAPAAPAVTASAHVPDVTAPADADR
jgi:flotillin